MQLDKPLYQKDCLSVTVTSRLDRLVNKGQIANEWQSLELQSDPSFFVSWCWIESWLDLCRDAGVELWVFRSFRNNELISLGVLAYSVILRRGMIRSRVLSLHEIPRRQYRMITEHNNLLIRTGYEDLAWQQFAQTLRNAPVKWDEIYLDGVGSSSFQALSHAKPTGRIYVEEGQAGWRRTLTPTDIDLETLIKPMSRNRRWQIRRTLKAYSEDGEVRIVAAASRDEAHQFFDAMGTMHTLRWNSVGEAGSFANPHWVAFHHSVIDKNFDCGDVQILRVDVASQHVGYIYILFRNKTAYMMQTGFKQEECNLRRPGYLSHCLAMTECAKRGVTAYDFLCGDAEYKRVLGGEHYSLHWARWQQNRLKFYFENTLLQSVRAARALKAKMTSRVESVIPLLYPEISFTEENWVFCSLALSLC